MRRALLPAIAVLVLVACGGSDGDGADGSGKSYCTEEGALTPPDSPDGVLSAAGIWLRPQTVTAFVPSTSPELVGVLFSETDDACRAYGQRAQTGREVRDFVVFVDAKALANLPITLALGLVGSPNTARLNFACPNDAGGFKKATGGTVTVTEYVAEQKIVGEVDAKFDTGEEVKAPFSTCFCGTCSTKYAGK